MLLEKVRYGFLSRMRKPEGLPPKVMRSDAQRLGAPQSIVYELSLGASLILAIAGFKFFPTVEAEPIALAQTQEAVSVEDIEITRQQERPPAPAKPPVVIEAPADEMLSDIPILDSELSAAKDAPPPVPKSNDAEEEYFIAVEDMPELIGGMTGLLRNLIYPELAVRAGLQGRVTVVAFLNEEGKVVKADVLKGIGAGCDEAAISAVMKAKFKPGRQRGKPVKTRISIPIEFRLTN